MAGGDGRIWAGLGVAAAVAIGAGVRAISPPPASYSPPPPPHSRRDVRSGGSRTHVPTFEEYVRTAWERGLKAWGNPSLRDPLAFDPRDPKYAGIQDPIAFIDLMNRQVVIHYEKLDALGVMSSLPGIFAHEVGHHVKWPHVLSNEARLRVLQHRILGPEAPPLGNLYWDLLINETVGRELGSPDDLVAVYHASHEEAERAAGVGAQAEGQGQGKKGGGAVHGENPPSAIFEFYMLCYEELWRLPQGHLVGQARALVKFPTARQDARRFVQRFYHMVDDPFVRFIAFCQVIKPYLERDRQEQQKQGGTGDIPMGNDLGEPTVGDWETVLGPDPQADAAIDEAERRGILPKRDAQKAREAGEDPLKTVDRIVQSRYGGRPGKQGQAFRLRLVSSVYERLVDQHLFRIPPQPAPEPQRIIPGPTEEWEWGDDPSQIDWNASVLRHGPMAVVTPLRREWLPDEPTLGTHAVPRIELYLDTSGSMPDPQKKLNAMTLAAQILATAAIRKGAAVRGVIYSWSDPLVSDWMLSERTAREWLLHYSGGGTRYPWDVLTASVRETRSAPPIRVVISDSDFLSNLSEHEGPPALEAAVRQSPFVALLHLGSREWADGVLKPWIGRSGFRLVTVPDMAGFAKTASDLADALFPAQGGSRTRGRRDSVRRVDGWSWNGR